MNGGGWRGKRDWVEIQLWGRTGRRSLPGLRSETGGTLRVVGTRGERWVGVRGCVW